MNSGWQVVDCSELEGSIHYVRGGLSIRRNGSEVGTVPLKRLAVLLIGTHVSISGAVLGKLAEYDVALLVCDWKKTPIAGLYPDASHTRIGARHLAQASLSLPKKKAAWAAIVRAKVAGQAANVASGEPDVSKRLIEMAKHVRSGDADNVEAQAARLYWPAFTGDADFHREGGVGEPGSFNSCLNYGYAILRGHSIRAIAAAGLSSALGLFHHGRSNAFNLADDLMEPFRPAVDYRIKRVLASYDLSLPENKRAIVDCVNGTFDSSGRTIPTALQDLAQCLGNYVELQVPSLLVPTWDPSGADRDE